MPSYVLDASALTALFENEPGGIRVRALIESAARRDDTVSIAVVNLGEVFYTLTRRRGAEARRIALSRIDDWSVNIVDADLDLTVEAAVLKAGQSMGYMDAFAAALARRLKATLVTKDPDFQRVEDHISIEWLPGV